MTFTNAQKVNIRRHCGYPAYSGFGWVFEQDYATLELRMNTMDTDETSQALTLLTSCDNAETAWLAVTTDLDTAEAAVWKRNPLQRQELKQQLRDCRKALCDFIGVKLGRALRSGASVVRT